MSSVGVPGGRWAVPVLAGRDAQIAVIESALAGIASTGTSVVLRGDPGMGKSALLKVAETMARRAGFRVLRMTGAEAESGLAFAALHQVLWPLLDDTRALPAGQRDALECALGVRAGTPPEGFAVAGAALTLLAQAAARQPVVVLLDDLQWTDPSSIDVFGYVQRRLAPLPVVVIGATRYARTVRRGGPATVLGDDDDIDGLPGRVIDLEPLDERQAERLLRALHPCLPERARRRVLRAAGGNPLALRELPARMRCPSAEHPAFPGEPRTTDALGATPHTSTENAGPDDRAPGNVGTDDREPENASPDHRAPGNTTPDDCDPDDCDPDDCDSDVCDPDDCDPDDCDPDDCDPEIADLFDELPLGERLGRLYEDRVRALPDGARHLLLVAALGGSFAQRVTVLEGIAERITVPQGIAEHVTVLQDIAQHVTDLRDIPEHGTEPPETPTPWMNWTKIRHHIETSGLARVDPETDRLTFRHPLVRASLTHSASPAERRAAHRLLADALPVGSPRRIMHRAAATLGTDDELAALLHAEAEDVAARGGDAEAAGMMARAAGLSAAASTRAARLVTAAAMAARGGRLRLAVELVAAAEAEVCPGRPEPAALYAFVVAYTRLQLDGDPTPAVDLLPAALDEFVGDPTSAVDLLPAALDEFVGDPTPAVDLRPGASEKFVSDPAPSADLLPTASNEFDGEPTPSTGLLPAAPDTPVSPTAGDQRAALLEPMLFLLIVVAVHTGDERAWAAAERHAAGASELAALAWRAWAGPFRPGHDVSRRLREAVAALPADRETAAAWLLLWTAAAIGAVGEHDALWSRFARRHAYATQAFIDLVRAHDDFLHGRWDASLAASRQGAETSAAVGYAFHERLFLHNVGQVLAARGDRAGLAALEPALRASAGARLPRSVTERLRGLEVLCALGHGRTDEAWELARRLIPPGAVPPRSPWFHLSLLDWVQAAVGSGRRAEARRLLRAIRASGIAHASAHHAFLVAAAEAIAANALAAGALASKYGGTDMDDDGGADDEDDDDGDDDERVERRYEAVYALPDAERWPFPLARVRLAHGAWLRRRSRNESAAAHCRAALTVFTRLGAAPWAEQAARELDALSAGSGGTGGGTGEPSGGTGGRHPLLSAQESRIAELVAQGLTNRQVGERLGLSPRTIGTHLYKIFPKLGITTRAGVARALEETRTAEERSGA
ncbi:AAA family ATPase [Streptomyces sp. NPDC003077]|uniref:helix-turn-helix transcriptional regulator n=1 Tax=Streptomyces sp. NPDC003077 TaxID=3154443 RepID=UPI0033B4E482